MVYKNFRQIFAKNLPFHPVFQFFYSGFGVPLSNVIGDLKLAGIVLHPAYA
jgi:hypothetical protein